MRAPLYASSEFPNANPDLHAGRIDPVLFPPDVDDAFGDGEVLVVEDLPDLATVADDIEVVGEQPKEPESPRESMIRLVAAVAHGESLEQAEERDDAFDFGAFSSLTLPTLPPIASDLMAAVEETDLDAAFEVEGQASEAPQALAEGKVEVEGKVEGKVEVEVEVEAAAVAATAEHTDAFSRLIATICSATFEHGATVAVDAIVELFSGRPVPAMLLGTASPGLIACGLASEDGGSIVLVDKVRKASIEWAKIVRDEGGDFEACGGKTLDEFSAEIACAILNDRAKFDTLRRALRGQGVAAYGFVCDAA